MTILKAKGQQTTAIQGVSEGADVYLRALRDGSIVSADWRQAAIIGGFGFMSNSGELSTGKVGGGAVTILDQDRPELLVSVPNGICIMPMRIGVHVQPGAPSDAEEQEILIAVDQDAAWDATGTCTAMAIYNMNTLSSKVSSCTGRHAFTTNITTPPVLDLELARLVIEYDVAAAGEVAQMLDLVYEPKTLMVINGPAMLLVYHGGDNVNIGGFIDAQWLEFPENTFSV